MTAELQQLIAGAAAHVERPQGAEARERRARAERLRPSPVDGGIALGGGAWLKRQAAQAEPVAIGALLAELESLLVAWPAGRPCGPVADRLRVMASSLERRAAPPRVEPARRVGVAAYRLIEPAAENQDGATTSQSRKHAGGG